MNFEKALLLAKTQADKKPIKNKIDKLKDTDKDR